MQVVRGATGKRPAAVASGVEPDDFSWLLHLFLLAAGSEPDPAEPGSPVMAVTTRPVAILMVRRLKRAAMYCFQHCWQRLWLLRPCFDPTLMVP